jgi:hypothetical protein
VRFSKTRSKHITTSGMWFSDFEGNISTELEKASESMLMLQSMTLYRLTCTEDV